jgi:hypothetical protein
MQLARKKGLAIYPDRVYNPSQIPERGMYFPREVYDVGYKEKLLHRKIRCRKGYR